MPKGCEEPWYHVDAILLSGQSAIKAVGQSAIYNCPNCKQNVRQTLTHLGLFGAAYEKRKSPVAQATTETVQEVVGV